MAGDLDVSERLLVASPPASAEEVELRSKLAEAPVEERPAVLHRYGQVLVVEDRATDEKATSPLARVAEAAPAQEQIEELLETEELGLQAFKLRESPDFIGAKKKRRRQGERWNMPGCGQFGGPPASALLERPALGPTPARAGAPTSAFLEGSVALGLLIVEGPTANLQFSQAERTKVVAEVQNGLSWFATTHPAGDLTFTYDIRTIRLDTPPDPNAADLEAVWRDPAMRQLGFSANWNGVVAYVEDLRRRFGTRWAYCAYFTKYPLGWFGYASIGGPRLVMDYAQDGWGPDNIDRVFAHETGHIFGAPDEYAASGCNCGGSWGRFGTVNGNCENCATDGVSCLMKGNDWAYCRWTPSHLGWGRGVKGNPALIQSRFGLRGNFELVAPSAFTGINFAWRNNDVPGLPWSDVSQFGQGVGEAANLTMIQSNYGHPGNLELIARVGDTLQFFWRDSGPAFRWNGPFQIATGVAGTPSFIQSRFGRQGNFELVVPDASSGVKFMWRNNDAAGLPWSSPITFGQSMGRVNSVSLIQSNFGSPGNLEMVARGRDKLYFSWRDSGPAFGWSNPVQIASGVRGTPALIQSRFGRQGNFELVVPDSSGGMKFMWRNNDAAGLPWSSPLRFAQSLGRVASVSLIQSNFGSPGNLEVIARVGATLQFLWRDSGPAFRWSSPARIL